MHVVLRIGENMEGMFGLGVRLVVDTQSLFKRMVLRRGRCDENGCRGREVCSDLCEINVILRTVVAPRGEQLTRCNGWEWGHA